jgi:HicB family
MSVLSLRIPGSMHHKIKEIAQKDHVSINQFINSAVAEKVAAFKTEEDLAVRAKNASRSKFFNVLKKVRDVKPSDEDV